MRTLKKALLTFGVAVMLVTVCPVQAVNAGTSTSANPVKISAKKTVYYGKTISLKKKKAKNYKSSDTSVLKVNSKGKVTPVKAGTAIVTYTIGKKTKAVQVTVKRAASSITLKTKTLTLKAGKKATIKASSKVALAYKSKNTKVATVSSKGVVTGVSAGTVKITTSGKANTKYAAPKSKTVTVKVKKGGSAISVDSKSLTTFVGVSEALECSSQVPLNYKVLGNCVTVDSSGKLKAVSTGTAKVVVSGTATAAYNKPTAVTVTVKVKESFVDTYIPASNEVYNMKVYEGVKTPELFLDTCSVIAKTIVSDGNWCYGSGGNYRGYWSARNSSNRNVNCSVFVSYAMQMFGTLPLNNRIYYSEKDSDNPGMHYIGDNKAETKALIAKYYDVIATNDKTVSQLDAAGNLKPGDILCSYFHMNVYAGKNENGVRTWYDFGCDGTKWSVEGIATCPDTHDHATNPFVRVLKTNNNNTRKISYIYRLKAQS